MMQTALVEETVPSIKWTSRVISLLIGEYEKLELEQLGFQFLDRIHVEIPKGWSLKSNGQGIEMIDQKKRKRGNVCYYQTNGKRKTIIELIRRYSPIFQFSGDDNQVSGCIKDNASGKIIYEVMTKNRMFYDAFDVSEQMHDFLNQHFPRWEDYGAYWD